MDGHPSKLLLGVAVALSVTACAQVRKVGKPAGEDTAAASADARKPAASTAPNKGRSGQPAREGKPPLPATPSGLVNDSAARQIKEELHRRGFLKRESPGAALDAETSDAVRRFQQQEGLAATGFPDQETLRRLNVDVKDAYRSAPRETAR